MLKAGDTFLLPKPGRIEHLWIVLTIPDQDNKAVCVNVTSKRDDSDETLVLKPGDHPFITKESVVHYEDARVMDLTLVNQLLARGSDRFVCEQRECCTYAILDRVRAGLLQSKRTPTGIKRHCKDAWHL